MEVDEGLEVFEFQFQTIAQNFTLYTDGYTSYNPADLTRIQYSGKVQTADHADLADIEKTFAAKQDGDTKQMKWNASSDRVFTYTIEDVARREAEGKLTISWDGAPLEAENKGEKEITIPSLSDFKVVNTTVHRNPEQYVELHFSDPILQQSLEGIITVEGAEGLTFTIENHVVRIYPDGLVTGSRLLNIDPAIRNIANHPMKDGYSQTIVFEQEKPALRIDQKKSIMPSGQGLILPFDAVALSAVDVYITKVFSDNILQYLQNNQLGGSDQLYYVGRHIYRKHIDLRQTAGTNIHNWHTYYLDLAEVIQVDPGAIYNVELRFKKEYAVYACSDDSDTDETPLTNPDVAQGWVTDGTYYVDDYDTGYDYDWENRENPCSGAYYNYYSTRQSIAVLASDLGITAKMGGDNELHVVVNDIRTAEPMSGVTATAYDFQMQKIANAQTNKDGFAQLKLTRKPFVVIASNAASKGYLKVDEYSGLSMSKFDVAGASVQDGIKGFIYGERGVWRPGDSLYLNFVVEDKENILPKNHPVTMELRNPRGQVVQRITKSKSLNGFYDFRTATTDEALTGNYLAEFKVGNRSYSRNLKVETVKPNRLKINFEFGAEPITKAADLKATLEAKWLHGATASNLKAHVKMSLSPSKTAFDKWSGYHFDNELEYQNDQSEISVFEGSLDAEGKTTIQPDIKDQLKNAPGMMKVAFNTKVFEPGGNFSEDYHSVLFAPYESFAGMKIPEGTMWGDALETEQRHEIALASVDAKGQPTAQQELEVTLYRINRRWWYDSYNGSGFNFLNSSSYQKISTRTVALSKGKGTYPIEIENDNWGRYVVVVKDLVSGHSSAKFMYFDWPYWMRANRTDSDASTILAFSADKENYNVGDVIKLTFPSPANGRALICIENGTRILEKFWVNTTEGETKAEITVTAEMAPNVFANIALIQPHAQTTNDRPIRMFGLIPLGVENPGTKLKPLITAPKVMRPESTAEIKVTEQSGKAMTYTLAVVDEGLLDLTRFKTPDPWNFFYAREAHGVRTWDMYDLVIGAFGDKAGSLLSIGGDDEAMDPSKQKAIRFKPMVRHLGPFYLPAGASKTHKIDVPNYIGSVRVMVVAGQDEAYGNAEVAVPVRSPVMVLGTLPRVLGPGEKVQLPVNVFAMEDAVKQVTLTITTNDLFGGSKTQTKTLTFKKPGDALEMFALETGNKTGIGKVHIEAVSGTAKSVHEIELDVRSPNPYYTTVRDTVLDPGAVWDARTTYFGIDGTNKAVVELSRLPAINLEKRLDYLIRYPHGCIEQITSAAFPQLYLKRMTPVSSERQMRIDDNIAEVLKRYRSFQNSSGGLSYWAGQSGENDWGTTYAGHFMLEAEAQGYALPAGLKTQWLRYQKNAARQWASGADRHYGYNHRIQAYRLYSLALAGSAEISAMNMLKSRPDLDVSSRWMLALAYAEAGQPEVAKKMISQTSKSIPEYTELSYSYGSNLRDEAFVLQTLLKLGMRTEAAEAAKDIAGHLGSESWYSTQTTAYCLAALSAFMGTNTGNDGLKAGFTQNGKTKDIATGQSLVQEVLVLPNGKGSFKVENRSEQPLFCRLISSGQPLTGREETRAKNLKMEVRYLDANYDPIDPAKLKMGTDFVAEVKEYNPGTRGHLQEMALTQVFPSGWEILNARMADSDATSQGGPGDNSNIPTYQDVRDDRVMTYFDLARSKTVVYRVRLNATYAGRYYLPAVVCSAMYDDAIMAVEKGMWVEVVEE
jgi:uncharacterized protein YfaS (alpha-2-macroglobulin family)